MIPKENTAEEPSSVTLQSTSLSSGLSLPVLAAHRLKETDKYRRGEPFAGRYGLQLLHRAMIQDDQEAWGLESEENYVAQTFERFWHATAYNQQVEFRSLAAALQHLRASVNGAILDTLRAYQRPQEVSLPESGAAGEPSVEDETYSSELWDTLNGLFSIPRERRLA